jgi:hypothetical protein
MLPNKTSLLHVIKFFLCLAKITVQSKKELGILFVLYYIEVKQNINRANAQTHRRLRLPMSFSIFPSEIVSVKVLI